MKKLLALLLAVVMVLGLMAGCNDTGKNTTPSNDGTQSTEGTQGTGSTEPALENAERYGGHLNARNYNKMNGLDPMSKTGLWNYHWTTCVYEPALTRDADNNIQPGVCDYELSEDQLTLKLWVQDGVTFHNGDVVDIYDVEATFKRAFEMYNSIKTRVYPYVESMEVDDASKTLTLKFTENREDILYYLASYQTWCAVQPKEICEKYTGTDADGNKLFNVDNIEDAIGTGPYKIVDHQMDVYLSLERYDGYKIRGEGLTGFAGPKYAYLDSITFWTNQDDSSATMALLSGEYDIVECVASEYADLLATEGIVETRWPSDTGCRLFFNTASSKSLVSQYPSLRKAIAAAIDFEEFLTVVTDNQQVMGGCPFLSPLYETDIFITQDYYGDQDLELAAKYIEQAKAEGWNGTDPVQILRDNARDDVPTLFRQYLEDANIPVELTILESGAVSDLKADKDNSTWDLDMDWTTWRYTPTTYSSNAFQVDPETDALIAEMKTLSPTSQEYIDKCEELSKVLVDDAGIVYMSMIDWFWYHPEEFVSNDEGLTRYFFNSYWTDPENHPKD